MNNIQALAEKGMYEEACQLIDKSPDIITSSEASCLSAIVSYYQSGRLDEAKRLCESYFYLVSDSPSYYSIYGAILRRLGDPFKSKQIFEEGLKKFEMEPSIANNYSNLLVDLGDLNSAKSILERLESTNPSNIIDIRKNLERIAHIRRMATNTPDKTVVKSSQRAIDPLLDAFCVDDVSESRTRLAGDSKKGDQDIEIAIDRDRASEIKEGLQLIRAIIKTDPQQALNDVRHLIESGHANGEIYQLQGDCHLQLKQLDGAETSYWRAAYFGNRDSAVYSNLSSMLLMNGDISGARFILSKAKELGLSPEHYDKQLASIEKVESKV